MKLLFRMNWALRRAVLADLSRPHEFAWERVGFIQCRAAHTDSGILVIAEGYSPVRDGDYVDDRTVGARIGGAAIRSALQVALTRNVGLFHVHVHDHYGMPGPSSTDLFESNRFVPDFFNAAPAMPHGTIIFSKDKAFGRCWLEKDAMPAAFDQLEFVGSPYRIVDVLA